MKKETQDSTKGWTTAAELPESAAKGIENLRHDIDTIDRKIVELLVKRQAVVEKVVSLKKRHHIPVHHPAREENLISDRRRQGKEVGLDPDYLEELFRRIMRQSRVEQSSSIAGKGVRPGAAVLVVGGTRGMGKYFHEWFQKAGYDARSMGSKDWGNIDTLCKDIVLAVISVPIDLTVSVIQKIAPHLPSDCVLTDLTSIKVSPMEAMLTAHSGPVIGLHPMFGPTTSTMDKQIVIATAGRDTKACEWVIDQFITWGAVMVQADAREHDEIMGIVQSLRHFANFAFGQFLHRRRINLGRSLDFSSPIYRLELCMVGRLFAQDPGLYSEIIFASQERRALLKDYLESVNENMVMIEKGDSEAFKKQFRSISEWFGPFSEQAMLESTYLIDKLIERF